MREKMRVRDVARPVGEDIDPEEGFDVKELDAAVSTCVSAASSALQRIPPPNFSDLERDFLVSITNGLRSSHSSVRKLLRDGHDSSSVDALVIARLQLETLYNVCFLLQDAQNLRNYVKNGWKKKYVRFLLHKEEAGHLLRFREFYLQTGPMSLEALRLSCFVTEEEKAWIDYEELGTLPMPPRREIREFPTPGKVINQVAEEQKHMLRRLYPEYQHLCSFAHGAGEASSYRTALDTRSPARHVIEPWKVFDLGQRQVAEPAVIVSTMSCICISTEIFGVYPTDVELAARLTQAWNVLTKVSLLGKAIWKLRARQVLGEL